MVAARPGASQLEPVWRGYDVAASGLGIPVFVLGTVLDQPELALFGLLCSVVGVALFFVRALWSTRTQKALGSVLRSFLYDPNPAPTDGARAQAFCDAIVKELPEDTAVWAWINEAVCALITGGRYLEALCFADRWAPEAQRNGTRSDPDQWALVEINLAEAEYNLGRVDDADTRMQRLTKRIQDEEGWFSRGSVAPIVLTGLAVQRAWIACLQNDPETAAQYLRAADKADLPIRFQAEIEYARALILARQGRFEEAEQAAEQGLSEAVRPSSKRNGLFLIGTILAERGDLEGADRAFERGAANAYAGQGGDALLRWGEVLQKLGREYEAKRAFEWCTQRDPQSPSAKVAEQRLVEGRGK